MIYHLNKLVDGVINPLSIGIFAIVLAAILFAYNRRRSAYAILFSAVAWLWLWGTPFFANWLGFRLESQWKATTAESIEKADAIVLLGGGMIDKKGNLPYPDMISAADRVWHAARLYRAGKAPVIIPTGTGVINAEKLLLMDLGVPEDAILCEPNARNTEENARYVEKLLIEKGVEVSVCRVLLVTSAAHMSRALLMYKSYTKNIDIIPVPCDHEYSTRYMRKRNIGDFFPTAYSLSHSTSIFKEYLGLWGYRLFR